MEQMSRPKPQIKLFDSSDDVAAAALTAFVDDANLAIKSHGRFTVAISGGRTPAKLFELLGDSIVSRQLEWDKIHLFWVDERCVAPQDKASNYGLAASLFVNKVLIPPENVHRVMGEQTDYSLTAKQYEQEVLNSFGLPYGQVPEFDFILLGMGADGHIASLFPNTVSVFETKDIVTAVYMMGDMPSRITLTRLVLTAAKHIVVLISGEEKAETLRNVLQSSPDEIKYPVHTLWPVLDKVTWLIDNEAGKYILP